MDKKILIKNNKNLTLIYYVVNGNYVKAYVEVDKINIKISICRIILEYFSSDEYCPIININ